MKKTVVVAVLLAGIGVGGFYLRGRMAHSVFGDNPIVSIPQQERTSKSDRWDERAQHTMNADQASLCTSAWFSSQRSYWTNRNYKFRLIRNGYFSQDESAYVLAVAFGADVQFVVFQARSGTGGFQQVFAEPIDVLDIEEFSDDATGCITDGAGIFFRTHVVDLAGDGRQEIILESNSIGACPSCLSEVRVFELHHEKVKKVLSETYNDIEFAQGKGLRLGSFEQGPNGPIPTAKSFFVTRNH